METLEQLAFAPLSRWNLSARLESYFEKLAAQCEDILADQIIEFDEQGWWIK